MARTQSTNVQGKSFGRFTLEIMKEKQISDEWLS